MSEAPSYPALLARIEVLRDAITTLTAERDEARAERDQFAEQAAARDQRDRDMQEIMRINNEIVQERDEARKQYAGAIKGLTAADEREKALRTERDEARRQRDDMQEALRLSGKIAHSARTDALKEAEEIARRCIPNGYQGFIGDATALGIATAIAALNQQSAAKGEGE